MWKLVAASALVCILLLVSYFLGGVTPEAYETFKVVFGCFGFIFFASAILMVYEYNQQKSPTG